MKNILYSFIVVVFLLTGCLDDNGLTESVFVHDPEFNDLPAYSEWGYNTFGAFYDREIFIYNEYLVPAKVVVSNDTMSFILTGQKGLEYTHYEEKRGRNKMSVTLKIAGFSPEKFSDLMILNDSTFSIDNERCKVLIFVDSTQYTPKILRGEFKFKRAQHLFVDKKETEVILSGYFDFIAIINEIPMNIKEGRFDVGIGQDNFFNY